MHFQAQYVTARNLHTTSDCNSVRPAHAKRVHILCHFMTMDKSHWWNSWFAFHFRHVNTTNQSNKVFRVRVSWTTSTCDIYTQRKRKRSDSVPWQKPLYQQKCQKGKVTTQTTPQKSSIKQRLRTDLGRSVGVTTATQLVWLTGLRAHLPTNRNSRLIKRTHV